MCSKSIEIEALLTKREINKESNINFFVIVFLVYSTLIPVSVPLTEALLNLFLVMM